MIKNVYECAKEEQFIMSMRGVYEAMSIAYREKEMYLVYKKNQENCIIDEILTKNIDNKMLDIKILELLEKNGFSLDELGTFLYKDVIKNVILTLQIIESQEEQVELKSELENAYSQFYFDISRNDKDMGLKTFHTYIRLSFSKINYDKVSIDFLKNLSIKNNVNYGDLALQLGISLLNNDKEQEVVNYNKNNIRKLVR